MLGELDPLETAVLQMLLAGDHPVLAVLRQQVPGLAVKKRDRTGAGFFTEFSVRAEVAPVQGPSAKARFGDVEAAISGLEHGAGFLLYIDNGLLSMLEGYSYEDDWPEQVREFSLRYTDPSRKSVFAELEANPGPIGGA